MKKKERFWRSLEKYGYGVARRSPLPWPYVGLALIIVVIAVSWGNVKNSVVSARNVRDVIEKAVNRGDYQTAKELLTNDGVLGVESELEDKVYPERVVERRIGVLEEKLKEYPENRDIYLALADLYGQLDNQEKSDEYREKARVLDPNKPIFQP